MAQSSLSFAKIVANPTETAWAQAYNEGSVFVVLSLTKTEDIEPESLPTIGKEILSIFRAEFFGLEEKSLSHLKHAAQKSFEHVPKSILISFVMAFNKEDLVYLVVIGGGKVMIKRDEKIGNLLEKSATEPSQETYSASGVLLSKDILLLQTQDFAQAVTKEQLNEALGLELPNDIAETLTPGIHNKEQGAAAGIILSFHGTPLHPVVDPEETQEETTAAELSATSQSRSEDQEEKLATPQAEEFVEPPLDRHPESHATEPEMIDDDEEMEEERKRFTLPHISLPKRSILLIGIVIVLVVLLIGSIIFTKQNQEQEATKKLFNEIYTSAEQDYDEGMSLLSLNKNLARDDFLQAQTTLKKGEGKFKEGSEEKKKYDELKKKIEDQLGGSATSQSVSATEISLEENTFLKTISENTSYTIFAQEDSSVFGANEKEIRSITDEDTLLTNDDTWSNLKGLAVYSGNLYLLDTKEGILKFVPAGTEYAPSTYFKGKKPDFAKAVSLAIDSSIYVLFSDGSVKKFTKGVVESFGLKGLSTPLSSPTKIVTSNELDNIYLLDPQNARIAIFDKTGAYVKEISASVLKNVTEFTLNDTEDAVIVLANNKAYSLSLK